jgi:hypothetical protein
MGTTEIDKARPGEVVTERNNVVPMREDPFLAMIANAATRPETIPAIRELNELRVAEIQRQARVAYSADFAQMQPKLPTIDRNGHIEIREKDAKTGKRDGDVQQSSPYAYWADILEACSPHMLEHGFGISFRHKTADDGKIIVTGILEHRDGHREENSIALIHETSGSKNPVQAIGSSLSYGMRYMGIMLLGVASKEHDDNKGMPASEVQSDNISDEQVVQLQTMLQNAGADKAQFLKLCKIDRLEDMPAAKFDGAVARIRARQEQASAK